MPCFVSRMQQAAADVDLYGFPLLSLTPADSEARARCSAREQRRRARWVPQELPATAWFHACHQLAATPSHRQTCCKHRQLLHSCSSNDRCILRLRSRHWHINQVKDLILTQGRCQQLQVAAVCGQAGAATRGSAEALLQKGVANSALSAAQQEQHVLLPAIVPAAGVAAECGIQDFHSCHRGCLCGRRAVASVVSHSCSVYW